MQSKTMTLNGSRYTVFRNIDGANWLTNLAYELIMDRSSTSCGFDGQPQNLAWNWDCCDYSDWKLSRIKKDIWPEIARWTEREFFPLLRTNGFKSGTMQNVKLVNALARHLKSSHSDRREMAAW